MCDMCAALLPFRTPTQAGEAAGGPALTGHRVGVFVFSCASDGASDGAAAAGDGPGRRLLFGTLVAYNPDTGTPAVLCRAADVVNEYHRWTN